jgi:hypothetical protein
VDRRSAETSAQAPTHAPRLSESLEHVRSAIADMAQSRERVQEQMNVLAEMQEKLEWQAGRAKRAGREDLVLAVHGRAGELQRQYSELAAQVNRLKTEEQRFAEQVQQVQARIDSPDGVSWEHSTATRGHRMRSDPSLLPPGSAWRVDAETAICALLPHVRGTGPTASNRGWWAIQPPLGGMTSVRAEALGPGYMVCLGSIQALDEVARNEVTLSGVFGQILGAAAVNFMESKKLAAPIAAFRHYGRTGEPVYLAFASDKHATEFPPGQLLHVRRGEWHGPCQRHSMEPFLEMAAALRSFMAHLWNHVGGSNLDDLRVTRLAISEADFMASVAKDVSSSMVPDVGQVAEYAGLVAFRRHDSGVVETGLTPAGAVWHLANQRRR